MLTEDYVALEGQPAARAPEAPTPKKNGVGGASGVRRPPRTQSFSMSHLSNSDKPTSGRCRTWCSDHATSVLLLLAMMNFLNAFMGPGFLEAVMTDKITQAKVMDSAADPTFPMMMVNDDPNSGVSLVVKKYIYNITNADAVGRHGHKPRLNITGPYVYNMLWRSVNVSFSEDKTRLRYRRCMWFEFDRAATHPSLSEADKVWLPNMEIMGLAVVAKQKGMPLAAVLAMLSMGGMNPAVSPFYELSVEEVLFGHYAKIGNPFAKEKMWIQGMSGFSTDSSLEYCLKRYNVDEVYTGHGDPSKAMVNVLSQNSSFFGICNTPDGICPELYQQEWDGKTDAFRAGKGYTRVWASHAANVVGGASPMYFPAGLRPGGEQSVLMNGMFRTMNLRNVGGKVVVQPETGMETLRYYITNETYGTAAAHPANKDYGQLEDAPAGLLNYTGMTGMGMFYSKPGFAGFPGRLQSDVEVLNPTLMENPADGGDAAETYMDVEPNSGIAVHSSTKQQSVLFVQHMPGMPMKFAKTPSVYLPLMWSDTSSAVPAKLIKPLATAIRVLATAELLMGVLGAALGVVFLSTAVWVQLREAQLRTHQLHASDAAQVLLCLPGRGAAAEAHRPLRVGALLLMGAVTALLFAMVYARAVCGGASVAGGVWYCGGGNPIGGFATRSSM